jgi:hypothetical protein
LLVDTSHLGSGKVGMGLFAGEEIKVEEKPVTLGYFFGKLAVLKESQLTEQHWRDPIFFQCRKNVLQFPDQYNPIIYPTGDNAPSDEERLRLFLIASNCCLASFANTAAEEECNASIRCVPPRFWAAKDGFQSLDHFAGVIRKPIFCLELTR